MALTNCFHEFPHGARLSQMLHSCTWARLFGCAAVLLLDDQLASMKKLSGGFGIAEALIALTVMGLGLAALSQGLNTSLKAQKNLDSKLDFTNQMRGIAEFVRDPANCATLVQVGTQINANSKMSFLIRNRASSMGHLAKVFTHLTLF
jgi:hypothetical protein